MLVVFRFFTTFLALHFVFALSAYSKSEQDTGRTGLDRTTEAVARARFNRQQRLFALSPRREAITIDQGNVAVLEDDGTVVTKLNFLDLANRSIIFTPAGAAQYSVVAQGAAFDAGAGSQTPLALRDDDTTQVSLPFPFAFYGSAYNSVFVNSDGNLTFTAGDTASSDRNLTRIANGPPRISPFFDDLNPENSGMVSVESLSDRVIFTWLSVGEWSIGGASIGQNTFQAVLNANGTIQFNYRRLDAPNAVVAIAPGKTAAAANSLVDLSSLTTPATLAGLIAEVFSTSQTMDLARIGEVFYRNHSDSYDGLIVFADFSVSLGGAFAYALPLRNSIQGIINVGRTQYDFGSEFGSAERLSVMVNMGEITRYPADPGATFLGTNNSLSILGQEFGHRWLALLDIGSPQLLGRDASHWSFVHNTFGSVLEGNEIEDLGGGNFRTTVSNVRYSPLDQYVMGLRSASEVPPWFVVTNAQVSGTPPAGFPTSCRDPIGLLSCSPFGGVRLSGTRQNVTIDDVIAKVGPRIPSAEESQKDFRVAFILVTRAGVAPRASSLLFLDRLRSQWQTFFVGAVDGRGTMSTDLLYYAPDITSIVPRRGSTLGGTTVVIRGSGFQPDAVVTIDSREATVNFIDENTLQVISPPGPQTGGTVNVAVRNPRDGQSDVVPAGFTYAVPASTEVNVEISANGSEHVQTTGTNGSIQVGYATLDGGIGLAVVRSGSGRETRSEAAVPAAITGTSFRVYAERSAATSTGIALLNTTNGPASITVQFSGGQTALTLAARSQTARFIHEIFPQIGTTFLGSVAITSDVPIGLVAVRGTVNQRNEFIMTNVPVGSGAVAATSLTFPQIADGAGYATELLLLNAGAATIGGTIEFSFTAVTDIGTNTKFTYEIPAGGVWRMRTTGSPSNVQVGYATVVAASGNAAPAATAVLRQTTAGNLNFETGVPAVSTVTNGIMFGVSDAVYRTALAVVNRSSSAAEIKLTAYRADGTLAAPSRTISLAPNEHRPRFLDELIPELAGTFDGVIVLDSTAPVHVITLRTVTNSLNAFLMTAMPVIDLNQVPPPATRYFPQLVDGGNYSTEYLILSTGGTSSSLRFFSTSGEPLLLPLR